MRANRTGSSRRSDRSVRNYRERDPIREVKPVIRETERQIEIGERKEEGGFDTRPVKVRLGSGAVRDTG